MSRDIYQEVTDKVVAMMETSGTNWTNPMTGGAKGWPFNPVTGNTYNGLNVLFLSMAGGGAFASFKQWQAKGCKIKKGSIGERRTFPPTRSTRLPRCMADAGAQNRRT